MAVRAAEVIEYALAAAQAKLKVQRNNHAAIKAQFVGRNAFSKSGSGRREMCLTPPICGEALRILLESEAMVAPGTLLIVVAETSDIEFEADLLSSDAVQLELGASAKVLDCVGWCLLPA